MVERGSRRGGRAGSLLAPGGCGQAESFEGETGIDGLDFGQAAGDEGGAAAGGDDPRAAASELEADLAEQLADQSAVAMDGADLHGFPGAAADGARDIADGDAGQQSGSVMEVLGHGGQAGGDDPADVAPARIDHIEGHGRAEVDDDGGAAVMMARSQGVGEAIGADGLGVGIADAEAGDGLPGQLEGGMAAETACPLGDAGRDAGDDAADRAGPDGAGAGEGAQGAAGARGQPGAGGDLGGPDHSTVIGKAEVGVGVADVKQQAHGLKMDGRREGV